MKKHLCSVSNKILTTGLILLFVTSCGSNKIVERDGILIPKGAKPHGVSDNPDIMYAKVAKRNGTWTLLEIAHKRMRIDFESGEERLFILTHNNEVLPDYEDYAYRPGTKGMFECDPAKHDSGSYYNPCKSAFSKNGSFGDGWFGWLKTLNTSEILRAVKDTDLANKSKVSLVAYEKERVRCDKMIIEASERVAKQTISPKLIDQTNMIRDVDSGWFKPIIKVNSAGVRCPDSINDLSGPYSIALLDSGKFVLEPKYSVDWKLSRDRYEKVRRYGDGPGDLAPVFKLTEVNVHGYTLNRTVSDKNITIHWATLTMDNKQITYDYSIDNNSSKYIDVQKLSFYTSDAVITFDLGGNFPPNTTNRYDTKHIDRNSISTAYLNTFNDLSVVHNNKMVDFGISVSYTIGGEPKTLYQLQKIRLSDIAKF